MANATQELLDDFGLEVFNYPSYSTDLAAREYRGYHLFPSLTMWLATQQFDRDAELHAGVPKPKVELAGGKFLHRRY